MLGSPDSREPRYLRAQTGESQDSREPRCLRAHVPRCPGSPSAKEHKCPGAQVPKSPKAQVPCLALLIHYMLESPDSREPRCLRAQVHRCPGSPSAQEHKMPRIGAQVPKSPKAQVPCLALLLKHYILGLLGHYMVFSTTLSAV
jgi:hypothetical protein